MNVFRKAARSGKVLIAAVVIPLILQIADFTDAVPIRPLLEHYFGTDNVSLVLLFWAILVASLRFATFNTSRGSRSDVDDEEPF